MNEALANLELVLRTSLGEAASRMDGWVDPEPFSRTLASIKRAFDNPAVQTNKETIAAATRAFRHSKQIPSYKVLRYICLGAGELYGEWCLLGDTELWAILRERAEQGELRQQLKCFQGLLRSYWSFPEESLVKTLPGFQGWLRLRHWLNDRFESIDSSLKSDSTARTPQWFRVLKDHRNLLLDEPCAPYSSALLKGDRTLLDSAIEGLGIPTTSWVLNEAIYAQVKHSTQLKDEDFQGTLPAVLNIALGDDGRGSSKSLTTRCVAALVSRYSRCAIRPENIRLRDASIEAIGNPWLRRAAWDAHVLESDGRPDETAREMVHGWLRTRLIKDFFELLSEERAADQRRLNYWLRFESSIEDMWFILGTNAFQSREKEYIDFKQRARGRILRLAGQTPATNNAFVMRIGDLAVIEFGEKGNACFVFGWNGLPVEVTKKLLSGLQHLEIDIATLRHRNNLARLIHLDSPSAGKSWEQKFDEQLRPVFRSSPSGPPFSLRKASVRSTGQVQGALWGGRPANTVLWTPPAQVKPASQTKDPQLFSWIDIGRHVAKYHLTVSDKRRVGGAFWVLVDNSKPELIDPLRSWGFRYKPGKGWWKE